MLVPEKWKKLVRSRTKSPAICACTTPCVRQCNAVIALRSVAGSETRPCRRMTLWLMSDTGNTNAQVTANLNEGAGGADLAKRILVAIKVAQPSVGEDFQHLADRQAPWVVHQHFPQAEFGPCTGTPYLRQCQRSIAASAVPATYFCRHTTREKGPHVPGLLIFSNLQHFAASNIATL